MEIVAELERSLWRWELGAAYRVRALGQRLRLGPTEFLVVAELLFRPEGLRPVVLAELVGIGESGVVTLLGRLGRRDLVRRVPDPDDGRGVVAVASPAAHALWQEGVRPDDYADIRVALSRLAVGRVRDIAAFVDFATDHAYRRTRQMRPYTSRG